MAIRGAKLTFGGRNFFWEYKSSRGHIRKNNKKEAIFVFVFLETVKFLYFIGAPFEFSGRASFKLVTPLTKRANQRTCSMSHDNRLTK